MFIIKVFDRIEIMCYNSNGCLCNQKGRISFFMYDVIAQAISIIGLCMNCGSFLQKKRRTLIMFQLVGSVMFAVHFGMIGAASGCLLNAIAFFRAIVFSNENFGKKDLRSYVFVFIGLFIVAYILGFILFGNNVNAANMIIELFPVLGMFSSTIALSFKKTGKIRLFSTASSVFWIIYNIIRYSIGGVLCEAISLVSIFAGIVMYDIKGKK